MVCRPYVICASFLSFSFFFGRTSRIKNIFISKACQVREIDNRQSLREFLIYLLFNLQPAAQSVCWLLLLPVPVIIFNSPCLPVRGFDLHAGHPRRPRDRKKSKRARKNSGEKVKNAKKIPLFFTFLTFFSPEFFLARLCTYQGQPTGI